MSTAASTSRLLASRRDLFAAISAAVGLDDVASGMHRPGKAPLDTFAADTALPTAAVPPGRAAWLARATFGYTPAAEAALTARPGATDAAKWQNWIEWQLDPGAIPDTACTQRINAAGYTTLGKSLTQLWTQHHADTDNYFNRMLPVNETECVTMLRAIHSERQLYERMAGFWHDHFSVFGWHYDIGPMFVHYDRDVIRPNVFGNFRALLEAVAQSTAMQYYLDNQASRGADFNENYARELIELHTLGVQNYYGPTDPFGVPCLSSTIHCGDGMPAGYVDNDVYEAAAALTGWTIKNGYWQYPADNDGSFIYRADWHDRRNKIFLGLYIPPNNQPAMQDGRTVFDRLVSHPGTARHIATKLCRRFVGDSPSETLITQVAQIFTAQINNPNQIGNMLRAILTSSEFLQGWGTGMRRPFEVAMAALRGLGADYTPRPDNTSAWTATERLVSYLQQAGHRAFYWGPPNGYPDVQRAWSGTGAMAMTLKLLAWLPEMRVNNDSSSAFVSDIVEKTKNAFPTASTRTAAAMVGWWADQLLGYRPEPTVGLVTTFLQQNAAANEALNIEVDSWAGNNPTPNLKAHYTQQRLRTAVGMLLMSPDYFRR